MQSTKRVLLNSSFLYLKTVLTVFISIYYSRFLLIGLGIEDYGVYNVVGGVIGVMGFVTATLSNTSTRFIAISLGENNLENSISVFKSIKHVTHKVVIYLAIALEIVGLIFINFVLKIPPDRMLAANVVYQFMIVNTVYSLLTAPYSGLLFSRERIVFITILDIIDIFVRLGIAILLTYSKLDNLILYGGLLTLLSFANRTVLKGYCKRTDIIARTDSNISGSEHKVIIKSLLSFSGYNMLESIGIISVRQGTIFLVNIFFGVTVNAAHGIASVVSMQLQQFSSSALRALQPQLIKSYGSKDVEKQEFLTFLVSKLGLILLAFVVIPVFCELDYILGIWLVKVPEFTSIFIRLSLIITLVGQMSYGLIVSMQAQGRIKELQITTLIMQLMNLPVSFVLFKMGYPVYTIYLVIIFLEFIMLGYRLHYAVKFVNLNIIKYVKKIIIWPTVMLLAAYFIEIYVPQNLFTPFYRLIMIIFINGGFVSLFSYFLIIEDKEKDIIKRLIHLFIRKVYDKTK